MHKSALTFGLLASTMVNLVVMPLLNNNSFSNTAFAQEYDKYGDSSYSQYPTDDKNYECRTGPFEGFFVSSVEFCKHVKFEDKDDRKDRDNRTGTQGPPGPAGPPGVPGPQGERGLTGATGMTGQASTVPGLQGERGFNGTQGPAGFTEINDTNLYYVNGAAATTATIITTQFTSVAFCEIGDIVIEGGYVVLGTNRDSSSPLVWEDGPTPNPLFVDPTENLPRDRSYFVTLGGGHVTFQAYAICLNNP